MAQATYTKLRDGSWGIRATTPVTAGQVITVTKKDGTQKQEKVGAVVWKGDGVVLASLSRESSSGDYKSHNEYGRRQPRGHKPCYMCGSYYCSGAFGDLCEDD
jgi:hypothetical protein